VIRTAFGLDAAQFAKLVGCGKSTIQHLETGARDLKADLADKIHLTTGVPRSALTEKNLPLRTVQQWLAARGPAKVGSALLRREDLAFVEAAFYALQLKNHNPELLMLAVTRAVEDTAARFGLSRSHLERLEREICDHIRSGRRDSENPGYVAAEKHFAKIDAELEVTLRRHGEEEFNRQLQRLREDAISQRARKLKRR